MEELKDRWPGEHWDHWMRSPEVHKFRNIVHPQVPRTFHNGVKGTFMSQSMHNQYFKDIAVQRDPAVKWEGSLGTSHPIYCDFLVSLVLDCSTEVVRQELSMARKPLYTRRVENMIKSCEVVRQVDDFFSHSGSILCAWIDVDPSPDPPQPFAPTSRFFHLWHEHRRGNLHGLHEFYFLDNYVLLLNTHRALGQASYRALKPQGL